MVVRLLLALLVFCTVSFSALFFSVCLLSSSSVWYGPCCLMQTNGWMKILIQLNLRWFIFITKVSALATFRRKLLPLNDRMTTQETAVDQYRDYFAALLFRAILLLFHKHTRDLSLHSFSTQTCRWYIVIFNTLASSHKLCHYYVIISFFSLNQFLKPRQTYS